MLLQGESGTGKEVIARYIHELSTRTEGPFLSINCGALPESLLESELFGHVKGSFTGAIRDKIGLFGAATKGTFFLDEIGETTPATQVKLLRALQHREVIPVGATEAVPVDTRVVAATNRDLDEEIRAGNFRSDLYYRLNVIALHLPPLRQRRDDIPLLAEHFLQRIAGTRAARSRSSCQHGGARGAGRVRVAGQRARAGERASSARSFSRRARRSTFARCPSASRERARRAARVDAHAAEPDARGGRARVHHVGAATARAATSRAPPRSSASIRRRSIASCRATEWKHERAPHRLCARERRSTARRMRLSVLIPVYNERDTIDLIIDQVRATPIAKEIICVDDHSTDGTQQILETLLAQGKHRQAVSSAGEPRQGRGDSAGAVDEHAATS